MGLMDDIASKLFKLKVFKNPSPEQMQGLRMEFKEKWPNAPKGEPSTRVTYDKDGNEYRWMADRSHGQVEPELKNIGINTNQNKDFYSILGLMGLLPPSDAEAQPIDLRVAGKRFMGLKNPTQQEAANYVKEMGGARGLYDEAKKDLVMWPTSPLHEPMMDALDMWKAKRLIFENPAMVKAFPKPEIFKGMAGLGLMGAALDPSLAEASPLPRMGGASRSFGTPFENAQNGVMPEGSPLSYQQLMDMVMGMSQPLRGLMR